MHSLLQARLLQTVQPNLAMNSARSARILAATLTIALLGGCASAPTPQAEVEIRDVRTQPDDSDAARDGESNAFDDGPALVATDIEAENAARRVSQAEYYQRQAQNQSDAEARVEATLSSAEYFVQANEHRKAADLVNSIRQFISTKEHLDRAAIILAYADYSENNCVSALARLDPLTRTETTIHNTDFNDPAQEYDNDVGDAADGLDQDNAQHAVRTREYIDVDQTVGSEESLTTQQVDALLLSSFCYQSLGDFESAISVLIRRESALYGSSRAETTRYLWQVINTISIEDRELIAQESQNTKVRNRVQQSLRGEIGDTVAAPQQFTQWREESNSLVENNTVIDGVWSIDSPRSVFVLLPLSSRFNKAAEALKAGIEREHLENQSSYKPDLRYYDIGDNPLQVGQYYAAAVRAGADFIIGPIGKSFSNEANNSGGYNQYSGYTSRAPLLLLGGDQALAAGNYRLSMSPEVEGRRVAERAWQDGHLSAGVLLANDLTSKRVLNGFTERWLSLGGKLSKTIEYSSRQFDHSVELKQLFDISRSEFRHRQLGQTLGFKPKFSPYQRGDIDFVFMVAKNQTGRIVRPQINFFTNSQMPVYATSSIYNGIEDTINDIDLDKTYFPVMPWVVRSANVAQYAGQLNMLHAMGMDAYRLAGNINKLRSQRNAAISGNMGQLLLQDNGELIYQPMWAEFKEGSLRVIDNRGLDATPLEVSSDNSDYYQDNAEYNREGNNGSSPKNGKGNYNDQNWDSRESRRKTGG